MYDKIAYLVNLSLQKEEKITSRIVRLVIEALVDIIKENALSGKRTLIPNLGVVKLIFKKSRFIRTPTGKTVFVPDHKRLIFVLSKKLKKFLM